MKPEKSRLVESKDCRNCKHHGYVADGVAVPYLVCVYNPPVPFGIFQQVKSHPMPGMKAVEGVEFMCQTVYPQPAIPCSKFERDTPPERERN